MGILSALRLVKSEPDLLENQYAPAVMNSVYGLGNLSDYGLGYDSAGIDLNSALQVPTVSKCRQLICGTIAGIPLELISKKTGERLGLPVWCEQPDIRQPRSVTISYTVQSLLFYQIAYWEVTQTYSDDGRPARFAWVQNDRVTPRLNSRGTEVESYSVDNTVRPMSGVGSLITFQSLQPAVLATGGRTIRAALDLEKAAAIAAQTPIASGYIKNAGADLPEAQVQGILAAWKAARSSRGTAFLTSTLSYETASFSPKDMMYGEAKSDLSTEICRLMNVPAYMASSDQNKSMTYQNILEARKDFYAYSLAPYVCAIEDRLSMNDITNASNIVRFASDTTFLRADSATRLATIEKMLTLELITLDQAKAMEQLTPQGGAV